MRCSDARLERLLVADESSAEYQSAAIHVETCSRCQTRLFELSGDNALLHEVRDTLKAYGESEPYRASIGSSVVISVESGRAPARPAPFHPIPNRALRTGRIRPSPPVAV